MDIKQTTELTKYDIRNSILMGLKYVAANLFTSGLLLAFHFIISILLGGQTAGAENFFTGSLTQTILMPLVILYYGHIAYNDGYRHSVAGKYNKNRIKLAMIPIVAIQLICVLWAIKINMDAATINELNPANLVSKFLMSPYAIIFNYLPELMPEFMLVLCVIPPVAMYIGYHMARKVEVVDHSMDSNAIEFRNKLEREQYKYDNTDDSNNNK